MKKVIVVDDSRFVYDEIRNDLDGSEFQIVAYCRDAEEAIKSYHQHRPDAVLMDIILPGIDGIEATAALTGRWPDARVIIVSSLAYDETVQRAKESGARHFIFKPFDKELLLEVLTQVTREA